MKNYFIGIMALLPLAAAGQNTRPNIVLFMVDDMGWQDTSVPFADDTTRLNRIYETPNMERLARRGAVFTNAYAASISSPSRCSLITGANASRHRVTNWTLRRGVSTDDNDSLMTPPDWNVNGVAQVDALDHTFAATSFVDLLRQSGYHTIHVGKAHFGAMDTPGEDPHHWGFEVNVSGHAGGGLASYLGEQRYGHTKDGKPVSPFAVPGLEKYWDTPTFVTEALTREAISALDKSRRYNQPWFLYMAHYAVHIPFDRDRRFYDKYRAKGLTDHEAAYAALIEGMDKSLGDLMDYLDRTGQTDNTIIIFMSDNGGLASSPEWRDGELYVQNRPLRSGKGSLLEGGIREPMIVSWPGVTRPGSRINDYVIIEDFYPSLLEMGGVTAYTTRQTVDGVSFVPLLRGDGHTNPQRALVWNMPNRWGNVGPGINFNCAIRRGNWKLIYSYTTGRKELYNLADDISEEHNLASAHPELVKELSALLGRLLRERGAQRPTFKTTGQAAPWPDEI